jgi:hypothetical protein
MTEKQEIRVKSMELAIKLLGLAVEKNAANIIKEHRTGLEQPSVLGTAEMLFDDVINLTDDVINLTQKVEEFITASP